jgi:sugar lactone lactonase YvrE
VVSRAPLLLACAALAGCAGEPALRQAPPSVLVAGQAIRGGQLSPGVDAAGAPRRPAGPFTVLGRPVAVAASAGDLYILDAAAGMLLRFDPFSNVLAQFAGGPFQPGTRIAADADLSLYLLDAVNRRVLRYGRDGRLLWSYSADATVGSITDFALDPARGRLVAVDGLHGQLVAFHPLGRAFEILPLRAEPRHRVWSLGAIALGPDALYASDPRCACLAKIAFDGRVLSTFGHERVRLPGPLAVDRHGRLIVSDRGDRTLKIFHGERLVEQVELAALGIHEATDLALADDRLYVADGPGAQIRVLHVLPPAKDEQ